jgi:hypothetical protein
VPAVADIFISYAREDAETAAELSRLFEHVGLSVFWDRSIVAGTPWGDVVEHELKACKCVVVLWSAASVTSRWVKTEARYALERNRLVPAILDDVEPPIEFRWVQAVELRSWTHRVDDEQFVALSEGVLQHCGGRDSHTVRVRPTRDGDAVSDLPPKAQIQPSRSGRRSIRARWLVLAALGLLLAVVTLISLRDAMSLNTSGQTADGRKGQTASATRAASLKWPGRSYAFLVDGGTNRAVPPMQSAAQDVKKVEYFLLQQEFDQVFTVRDEDLTVDAFRSLERFFIQKIRSNDRVVFYYSGRGYTRGSGDNIRGYFPLGDDQSDGNPKKSIAMDEVVSSVSRLPTNQILIVLDAPFSDLAMQHHDSSDDSSARPLSGPSVEQRLKAQIEKALDQISPSEGRAQYLIVSGTQDKDGVAGEQWDGSLFTDAMIRGLGREADLNDDLTITVRAVYLASGLSGE